MWPETARPWPLHHWLEHPGSYAIPETQDLARTLGISILTGVEYARVRSRTDYDLFNAAMAVDPQGKLHPKWTAKVFLVPFTEILPYRGFLGPMLEGILNEAGITTFEQLAASTVDQLQDILPDLHDSRVEKEDWLGQAQRFAAAKALGQDLEELARDDQET